MEIFSTIFRMEMARKITGTDIFIYGQYTYTQQRIMDENRSKRTCRSTYEKNTTSAHAVSLNLHFDRMMAAVIYKKIMNDPAYHSMPLSKKFSLFLLFHRSFAYSSTPAPEYKMAQYQNEKKGTSVIIRQSHRPIILFQML